VLLSFAEWCESLFISEVIRNSTWAFAVIMSIHLLGLITLGGSTLIVDLRMVGTGLKNQPVRDLYRDARPYMVGGLIVLVITGVLMFVVQAVRYYYTLFFWLKIGTLIVAILFTFLIRNRIARNAGLGTGAAVAAAGAASILLWFVVAATGRWVGFS
jgi:hypothetical protein